MKTKETLEERAERISKELDIDESPEAWDRFNQVLDALLKLPPGKATEKRK